MSTLFTERLELRPYPLNLRSIRVAEKIGERLEGTVLLPHVPDRSILQYGISRAEWQNRAV